MPNFKENQSMKIVGAHKLKDKCYFIIIPIFKNSSDFSSLDLVTLKEARILYPQMVINFYEKHMKHIIQNSDTQDKNQKEGFSYPDIYVDFDKNEDYQPQSVIGVHKSNGKLNFLVKYQNEKEDLQLIDLKSSDEAHLSFPQLVLSFYEKNLNWIDEPLHCRETLDSTIITQRHIQTLHGNNFLSSHIVEEFLRLDNQNKKIYILDTNVISNLFHDKPQTISKKFKQGLLQFDVIAGVVQRAENPVHVNHFCLFLADCNSYEITYLDPMGETENDKLKILVNWNKWMQDFSLRKWNFKRYLHLKQIDGVNCGVFVCYFFENIIGNTPENLYLNEMPDLAKYRLSIRDKLKKS